MASVGFIRPIIVAHTMRFVWKFLPESALEILKGLPLVLPLRNFVVILYLGLLSCIDYESTCPPLVWIKILAVTNVLTVSVSKLVLAHF